MIEDLQAQITDFLKTIGNFLTKTILGRLTLIAGIIGLLQSLGLLNIIFHWLGQTFSSIISFFTGMHYGVPVFYWGLIVAAILFLIAIALWQSLYLRLVSGVFYDNFTHGLGKWEYGGEGWKSEKEDGKWILSVSESPDGGITKKGFTWSDYEFSFENKVINKNVGWLVRAENRNKYLMIQLNMEDPKKVPSLRLHLRIPPSERPYQWVVIQENNINLDKSLNVMDWVKVKIVVHGSNIDVYLNNTHSAHYFISDPLRWQEEFNIQGENKETEPRKGAYITSINYSGGKVGFRCYGDEHAHIRNVKVKPLLY